MKKISVLISAYDSKEFILDAIHSVIFQKLPKNYSLEIIIGVDGCKRTWEAISNLRYKAIKLINMAHNYGPYVTFNTMMRFATGDLIARFDADDVMLQNYLYHQILILDSSADIQITRTWSIYTDLNYSPLAAPLANGTRTSPDGKRKRGSDGQFIMKKQVWKALGSFKPWKCFADSDFLTRARFLGVNIYELDKYLYLRRVHNKCLTLKNETSYNSRLRQTYKEIMESDKSSYARRSDVFISPVIGYIENVV